MPDRALETLIDGERRDREGRAHRGGDHEKGQGRGGQAGGWCRSQDAHSGHGHGPHRPRVGLVSSGARHRPPEDGSVLTPTSSPRSPVPASLLALPRFARLGAQGGEMRSDSEGHLAARKPRLSSGESNPGLPSPEASLLPSIAPRVSGGRQGSDRMRCFQ